ncbi:MAG: YjjG family noncanonical pyrimidine nucleotidase [Lachnospiraceae bacterium]
MRKYTTVFWDLDQTLLDFDRSMEYALQAVFAQYGLKINEEMTARYSVINRSYWLRLESGELSKEQVTVGRFRTFFEELGITHVSPEELNVDYQRELGSVFFFMEGAKELVALLKERGYRQYVVTNGVNATQANKMRLSGLDRIMDGVFVSELMGYPKPRKEFFDGCFAALSDVDRNKCILVGDSLTSDMRGAENAGITSCWFNPEKQEKDVDARTDYEIRRLEELIPILEQE